MNIKAKALAPQHANMGKTHELVQLQQLIGYFSAMDEFGRGLIMGLAEKQATSHPKRRASLRLVVGGPI